MRKVKMFFNVLTNKVLLVEFLAKRVDKWIISVLYHFINLYSRKSLACSDFNEVRRYNIMCHAWFSSYCRYLDFKASVITSWSVTHKGVDDVYAKAN